MDVTKLTVVALRKELKARDLKVGGKKAVLVSRLKKAIEDESLNLASDESKDEKGSVVESSAMIQDDDDESKNAEKSSELEAQSEIIADSSNLSSSSHDSPHKNAKPSSEGDFSVDSEAVEVSAKDVTEIEVNTTPSVVEQIAGTDTQKQLKISTSENEKIDDKTTGEETEPSANEKNTSGTLEESKADHVVQNSIQQLKEEFSEKKHEIDKSDARISSSTRTSLDIGEKDGSIGISEKRKSIKRKHAQEQHEYRTLQGFRFVEISRLQRPYTQNDLADMLSAYGEVSKINSNKHKSVALVEFGNRTEKSIESLDGKRWPLDGRHLVVSKLTSEEYERRLKDLDADQSSESKEYREPPQKRIREVVRDHHLKKTKARPHIYYKFSKGFKAR